LIAIGVLALFSGSFLLSQATSAPGKNSPGRAVSVPVPAAALFVVANDMDLDDAVKKGKDQWQKDDPDQNGAMEALALIRGGKLSDLPQMRARELQNENIWYRRMNTFCRKYSPHGKELTLIHNGAAVGTATSLLKNDSQYEDMPVKLKLSDRSIGTMIAITSSNAVHLHENRAERLTAEDHDAVLRAARLELRKNKVPVSAKIQIDSIYSARLSPKDTRSILAGVSYTDKRHFCHLLLILDDVNGVYKTSNVDISVAKSNQDSRNIMVYTPIDQLDIDGDGIDEVLVHVMYYEGDDYFVLQFKNGAWREVYMTNYPDLEG